MPQSYQIVQGDVLAVLKTLPADHFDAVLSDPPYGLSFMGKEWDKGVPSAETYRELLRVLKPGAMGLHFGGTRMWHRLAVNLEDAGFELRDTVMWLYGSGFPKSHNIGKALDKQDAADMRTARQFRFTAWVRGTGLTAKRIDELTGTKMGSHYTTHPTQPAVATRALFELLRPHFGCEVPAWVEQLVDERTVESENFKKREVVGRGEYGIAGAFGKDTWASVEGTRDSSAFNITAPATPAAKLWDGYGTALKPAWEPALLVQKPLAGTFANNALVHGCGALNVEGSRVGDFQCDTPSGLARWNDYRHGEGKYPVEATTPAAIGRFPANLILDEEAGEALGEPSRFFYCAKVSTKERNAGCEEFDELPVFDGPGGQMGANMGSKSGPKRNSHPTLKPLALTEYLAKLLLVPPRADGQPRRLLVPFSGAGSEMIGCLRAGWDEVWGIELDGEYVRIASARIEHHTEAEPLAPEAKAA